MKITYVTGNKYKIELAQRILGPLGIEIVQKKIYCPEIQDDKIENVSKFSAQYATNKLETPVIKNDSGLVIEALNGFPGPYTAYVENTLTEDGILKLMADIENRKAYFIEVISYCKPNCEPISFISKTEGKISLEKRGEFGWSYDRIFIPKGETKTLAEFNDDERWKFWSNDAYIQLKDFLLKNKGSNTLGSKYSLYTKDNRPTSVSTIILNGIRGDIILLVSPIPGNILVIDITITPISSQTYLRYRHMTFYLNLLSVLDLLLFLC